MAGSKLPGYVGKILRVNLSFEDLVKAVWIYYILLLLVPFLITIYAPLVTWLPSTTMKR